MHKRAHGTHCAGVALAAGASGASGVAPGARLLPVAMSPSDLGLGSITDEANAIRYAVDNGADVICCAWGPVDGLGKTQPLPEAMRSAILYAVTVGRAGRGCVVVFAAGNGGELVDLDEYASHPMVIAVGACNSSNRRSAYSDFGQRLWCCFPSDDDGLASVWTTDPRGPLAMNVGHPLFGDLAGDYYSGFGGTSCSAAGVAGIAALILGANPELCWHEVKDVIRETCDRIDLEHGQYDAFGHSIFYGYGRVNALAAVRRARAQRN
jgi:subtilisin family serine protease